MNEQHYEEAVNLEHNHYFPIYPSWCNNIHFLNSGVQKALQSNIKHQITNITAQI